MVIDDAIGTAHDHNNIIMSSVIIYMHYVNCTCVRRVCALRALVKKCHLNSFYLADVPLLEGRIVIRGNFGHTKVTPTIP